MWNDDGIKAGRGRRDNSKKTRSFEQVLERRQRAQERQALSEALSPEQKLARLEERLKSGAVPGEAKKERARLQGLIDAAQQRKLAKQREALNPVNIESGIRKENDALVKKMQTQKARRGARELFNSTSQELGKAAVRAAQRVSAPNDPGDFLRRQRAERWAQKKARKDKRDE